MKKVGIHYSQLLLNGGVFSFYASFMVWLFPCWSFDGGLSSYGAHARDKEVQLFQGRKQS